MGRYVPKGKLSKKARKELDKKFRLTWGGVNPVTKKIESKKAAARRNPQTERDDYPFEGYFIA